jgi:hypothetical protein
MCIAFHVKYSLFLSDFNKTRTLSKDFRKILKTSNFMKIRLVGADYHADRHTDMTNLIFTVRNFANAPKKLLMI